MNIPLTELPEGEIWRYLGCGDRRDPQTAAMVATATRQLLETARPKAVWRQVEIGVEAQGVLVKEWQITLPGVALAKHLAGCAQAVVLAATVGVQVDRLIARHKVENLAMGVVLDSCATAAIEAVCDQVEQEVAAALPGGYFSSRFSPGYGDLPLEVQGALLAWLDAPRQIGLCATDSHILTPRKSVTAIMGVARQPLGRTVGRCQSCGMQRTCSFAARGEHCGL